MIRIMVPLVLLLVVVWSDPSSARRASFTPEQKTQLSHIQTIWVSAVALSEKGRVPPDRILKVVRHRFEDLGFVVVTEAVDSHDVEFHIVCEERKRRQNVARYGGDAELTHTPDRLWRGPACQLSYRLDGKDLGWHKEVHASKDEIPQLAPEEPASDSGASAFMQLSRELERFDFPVLLLSEWGQTHRLVALLIAPETTHTRELLILDLLRQFPVSEAYPHLLTLIQQGQDPDEAIEALSGIGQAVVPHLQLFFHSETSDVSIRAAAARGLGRILRASGNPDVLAMMFEYLSKSVSQMTSSADIEFPVLTEVVWAFDSIHNDEATLELFDTLETRIWMIHDTSPAMKELRNAVGVVRKYMDPNQL